MIVKSVTADVYEQKITIWLFSISIGFSLLLSILLSLNCRYGIASGLAANRHTTEDSKKLIVYILLAVFFTIALFAGRKLISHLSSKGLPIAFFISIAVFNLLLPVPELSLRLAGFRHESGVQFGYPRPTQFYNFVHDMDLFWTFDPKLPGVNRQGFHEVPFKEKRKDRTRLLFLGDSCTHQGYPELVERKMNSGKMANLKSVESLNLAIPGYTSHQGKIVAQKYGIDLNPDLAIVFFGWNDHWLAYGNIDSEKPKIAVSRPNSLVLNINRLRLVQFVRLIIGQKAQALDKPRVPIDEYRKNLDTIATLFNEKNIPVLFVTAPSAHYQQGFPESLIELGFAKDARQAIEGHRNYNAVLRSLAKGEERYLLDLEAILEKQDSRGSFSADGIHFTDKGLADLAEIFAKKISSILGRD